MILMALGFPGRRSVQWLYGDHCRHANARAWMFAPSATRCAPPCSSVWVGSRSPMNGRLNGRVIAPRLTADLQPQASNLPHVR